MKNQWIIKNFMRKSAVRVIIVTEDKRLKEFWAIPEDGIISAGGYSFRLSEDEFLLKNNVPTYVFNYNNAEPLNLLTEKKSYLTPKELNTGIKNKLIAELIASLDKTFGTDFMITLVALALGFIGLGYFINEKLVAIQTALESLGVE